MLWSAQARTFDKADIVMLLASIMSYPRPMVMSVAFYIQTIQLEWDIGEAHRSSSLHC